MRTHPTVLLTVVGFVGLVASAAAHHGFDTEYDNDKVVTASGVVAKIEWTNPHMHVYVDVTDAGRKVLATQRADWARFVAALGQVAGVRYA